jgi:hypothetical protein
LPVFLRGLQGKLAGQLDALFDGDSKIPGNPAEDTGWRGGFASAQFANLRLVVSL